MTHSPRRLALLLLLAPLLGLTSASLAEAQRRGMPRMPRGFGRSAKDLHVVVASIVRSPRRLAAQCEGLRQQVFQSLAATGAVTQRPAFGQQLLIRAAGRLRFQRVNASQRCAFIMRRGSENRS